ncbi:MAG TPA: hypothetical protein DEB39_17135 [Planctomycetaceae bacterium]|nr:hypothetical protein [Planctomycetaceae bacterium]
MADRLMQCVARFESATQYNACNVNRFDANNISSRHNTVVRFASGGKWHYKATAIFDADKLFVNPSVRVSGMFTLTRSWDTGTKGTFEAIRPSFQQAAGTFDALMYLKYASAVGAFDARTTFFKNWSSTFDIMPGYQRVKTSGLFDGTGQTKTSLPLHKQAFVKPCWRILIRNTATNEQRDLGFINFDSAEKSIIDIELPDGNYEITLLYSSLFWSRAIDRVVRNVTIRSDAEPALGLPPILNLRSEIENGITRILWDSESGFDDVTFGLWFSESPPVVTFRESDQIVEYSDSILEYRGNVTQTQSMWCVVTAIKANMRGPASEIFLPWESTPPKRPNDQMVFHQFLDEKLQQRNVSTLHRG